MKFINPSELDKIDLSTCVPKCKISHLRTVLVERLRLAQRYYGKPFVYNSAFRSLTWEASKGRSGTSSHCKGFAVDIKAVDHNDRRRIFLALSLAGFERIGIAKTFIHADLDPDKYPSLWLYDPDDTTKTF